MYGFMTKTWSFDEPEACTVNFISVSQLFFLFCFAFLISLGGTGWLLWPGAGHFLSSGWFVSNKIVSLERRPMQGKQNAVVCYFKLGVFPLSLTRV